MDEYVIYDTNCGGEYVKIATFYNEEDAKLFVKAYETEYPDNFLWVTKLEYDERTIYIYNGTKQWLESEVE